MAQFRTLGILAGILLLAGIGTYARFADLGQFSTADEARWHANVDNFTSALAHANFVETYQLPHPGITLQWLASPTVHGDAWTTRKSTLIAAQYILLLITGYIFYRLWGKQAALILLSLLILNPLLIAHTRVYAMDSLLAVFLLLSLGCLFLWRKTASARYLVLAGIAGALAILSKLPGIVILPFSLLLIIYWHKHQPRLAVQWAATWLIACVVALPIVFPALAVRPAVMIQNMLEFFSSDDYTELHPASNWYYGRTLIFFSTPLHLAGLLLLPFVWKKISKVRQEQIAVLLIFAVGFVFVMSLGSKMGDRYILPIFLILDALIATAFAGIIKSSVKTPDLRYVTYGFLALFLWQAADVYRLHPYHLAYINPITKPFFDERRLGWGEGLELAAAYLNQKPDASNLKAAAYYPTIFADSFVGTTVPLHEWDAGGVDYAVLYRAQLERGESAWETDVLQQFRSKKPEHVITLNDLPYVWIYTVENKE